LVQEREVFFVKTNIRFYDLAAVRGLHSLTGSFEP
jgi:hypothetical protein